MEKVNKRVSKENLVAFLNSRMSALKMTKVRDLATKAEIDEAVASRLLNVNSNEIGRYDTLIKVAVALKVKPGVLLDAYAGLPLDNVPDPKLQEIQEMASQLSPEALSMVIQIVGFFVEAENAAHNAAIEAKWDAELKAEAELGEIARQERQFDNKTIHNIVRKKITKPTKEESQNKNSA